jgi:large subunit ribosomal protein L14
MIQVGTYLEIMDNSGGKTAQCIRVMKKDRAKVGDIILVTIKKALPRHRVKKGTLHRALVIHTKKSLKRLDGSSIQNDQNRAILLTAQDNPVGTRVTGSFNYEIRKKATRCWALCQSIQ